MNLKWMALEMKMKGTDGNDVEDDDDRIPNDEEVCDNLFKELREKNIDASNEN